MLGIAALAAAFASITAPAPVTALAADGNLVAYAAGRSPARDCDRIRVASRTSGRVLGRLGRATPCVGTSTGTGIAQLSMVGRRVVWLHYTGGNIREWSLYTATLQRPAPRLLGFWAQDVDLPAPVVVGEGDSTRLGDFLPYAVGREVRVVAAGGGRVATWTEPARVTALSAGCGGVVVATADGRVSLRNDDDWDRVRNVWPGAAPASAAFCADFGVVIQRGRTLEWHSDQSRSFGLPRGARVTDAEYGDVIYLVGGRAKVLSFLTGRTRDLGRARHARLELLSAIVASGRTIRAFRVD